MFFYPDTSEILETWISIASFQVVRIEKQISPFVFWEKVLNAAQAAKIIARKIKPEQMKLLEAAVNSASDGKPLIVMEF